MKVKPLGLTSRPQIMIALRSMDGSLTNSLPRSNSGPLAFTMWQTQPAERNLSGLRAGFF